MADAGYTIGQTYQPGNIDLASLVSQYSNVLPQLLQIQQQYAPQFTAADLSLQKQYLPQYNDMYASEAKRLNPYTYGLQEQLAQIANQGVSGGVPASLQRGYLNNLRANVDQNVGSPIAGDYISQGLAQLGEQYKQNYQNLGLSLLGKSASPMSTQAYSPALTSSYDMGSAASTGINAYNAYNTAMRGSYYAAPNLKMSGNYGGALSGAIGGGLSAGTATGFNPYAMTAGAAAGGASGYFGGR